MLYSTSRKIFNMKKYIAYIFTLLTIGIVLFVAYINFDAITGAFGDGPPYYSRMTNMDKWENPVPYLIAIDLIFLVVALYVKKWILRKFK